MYWLYFRVCSKYIILLIQYSNIEENINKRVDDAIGLFLYPQVIKKMPTMPAVLENNTQLRELFYAEKWDIYTLATIDEICFDGKEFITTYLETRPRNVSILFLLFLLFICRL